MRTCEYMYGMFGLYCVSLLHVKYVCAMADWCSTKDTHNWPYEKHEKTCDISTLSIYEHDCSEMVHDVSLLMKCSTTDTAAEQLKRYS